MLAPGRGSVRIEQGATIIQTIAVARIAASREDNPCSCIARRDEYPDVLDRGAYLDCEGGPGSIIAIPGKCRSAKDLDDDDCRRELGISTGEETYQFCEGAIDTGFGAADALGCSARPEARTSSAHCAIKRRIVEYCKNILSLLRSILKIS